MPDLVGIGSINVDLIIDAAAAATVDLTDPRLGLTADDIGNERAVSAEELTGAVDDLRAMGAGAPVASPGGSALNVVASVAATGAPISVGHVGVRGRAEPPGVDLVAWLDRLGIDRSLIGDVDGPPGLCLAITRGVERTLLTTGGANRELGRWLAERGPQLVDGLRTARAVHVTSLAGLDDLDPLVDLLDRLRAIGGIELSCDPGAIWTADDRAPGSDRILARCQRLLVNRREEAALGGAAAILDRWPTVIEVVVKRSDRVELHHRDRPPTVVTNPEVLGPDDIVDDTGSGDAFAAGYLVGRVLPDVDPVDAVRLGMDLARTKLGFPGVTGIDRYGELWRRFDRGGRRK